jgi:hypothetical protein
MKNVLLAFALISAPAFAVDQQSINFEQLKEACKNPAQFQNQNKPSSMKLDCKDRILFWMPAANGAAELKNSREVAYRVSSDKYGVPSAKKNIDYPSLAVVCPQFQLFASDAQISKEITCADVENYEGTAIDMCTQHLNDLRRDNSKVIEDGYVAVDGQTRSFCTAKGPEQKPAPVMPKPPVPSKPSKPGKPERPSK